MFDGEVITQTAGGRSGSRCGMARTFQITEIFPELTVRENVRIGVESAAGLQPALWLQPADGGRGASAAIDEVLALTGLTGEGRPAGGRAVAWRPARRRDRHGADA